MYLDLLLYNVNELDSWQDLHIVFSLVSWVMTKEIFLIYSFFRNVRRNYVWKRNWQNGSNSFMELRTKHWEKDSVYPMTNMTLPLCPGKLFMKTNTRLKNISKWHYLVICKNKDHNEYTTLPQRLKWIYYNDQFYWSSLCAFLGTFKNSMILNFIDEELTKTFWILCSPLRSHNNIAIQNRVSLVESTIISCMGYVIASRVCCANLLNERKI